MSTGLSHGLLAKLATVEPARLTVGHANGHAAGLAASHTCFAATVGNAATVPFLLPAHMHISTTLLQSLVSGVHGTLMIGDLK